MNYDNAREQTWAWTAETLKYKEELEKANAIIAELRDRGRLQPTKEEEMALCPTCYREYNIQDYLEIQAARSAHKLKEQLRVCELRLHEVAVGCATAEQENKKLREELKQEQTKRHELAKYVELTYGTVIER